MTPSDWAVVELSSFQLMDMDRSAQVAVVTNLAPNHLDVHKDMEEYVRAKRQVFLHQKAGDVLVLNWDNEITRSFASQAPGRVRFFSRLERPDRGVFLEGGVIYRADDRGTVPVLAQKDILLPGMHNVENYMAALAALEALCPTRRPGRWPRPSVVWSIASSWSGSKMGFAFTMTPLPPAPAAP